MTIGLSYKPSHISLPDTSPYFPRNGKSPSKMYTTNPLDSPIISPRVSSPRSPCGSGMKNYFSPSEAQSPQTNESLSRFNFLSMQATKNRQSDNSPKRQIPNNSDSSLSNFRTVTPELLAELMQSNNPSQVLIIDMRSFVHYSQSHINDAVNLCIPNTLLKRPSFGVEKLAETLITENDRKILNNWMNYASIVMYDASSEFIADNTPIIHLAKKFMGKASSVSIGWLKGGFDNFQSKFSNLCKVNSIIPAKVSASKPLPSPSTFLAGPLTCPTPTLGGMTTPFFNNIRPHHDVTCELGEIVAVRTPVKSQNPVSGLPPFLADVAYNAQGKYKLSQTFKRIDKVEQKRLQSLLIAQAHHVCQSNPYSIAAGIERGSKNRYNNIWPYEHSRVKLEHSGRSDSDYINASFIHSKGISSQYIATQAPLPSTFSDFWEMIWEQNSRVIVMLTKEEEAGRIKCHRYWPDTITSPPITYEENVQVKLVSESLPLENDTTVTLRNLILTNLHTGEERSIHQLHFIGWPDFGIPTDPTGVLGLRDIAHDIQQSQESGPMIVHCSAGCGRTGAFCTIDTVLETLASKQQSINTLQEDMIAEVVDQFRDQRLSMVQTLRQFVFCYEAVLWRLVGAPGCQRKSTGVSKPIKPVSMPHVAQHNADPVPKSSQTELILNPPSGADFFSFSPSHNTSLSFNDPRRTSYFG
ncbi:phosphotyrosine-specific ptp2-like protein [Basidiobolus ranarum]|uniref:protein-tyrosine-phosphatase n=1 Tax=Basidiobolus ranarum TaxID=34480 RepID=A0ABR2X4B6_9FUNG